MWWMRRAPRNGGRQRRRGSGGGVVSRGARAADFIFFDDGGRLLFGLSIVVVVWGSAALGRVEDFDEVGDATRTPRFLGRRRRFFSRRLSRRRRLVLRLKRAHEGRQLGGAPHLGRGVRRLRRLPTSFRSRLLVVIFFFFFGRRRTRRRREARDEARQFARPSFRRLVPRRRRRIESPPRVLPLEARHEARQLGRAPPRLLLLFFFFFLGTGVFCTCGVRHPAQ
mmetsp:Transcript_21210/g.84518  ORF Transcript_21210/g.84518 Transcript_21210/m.84518 type:complete len:224 (+) Transcript_21210:696-1367(+)